MKIVRIVVAMLVLVAAATLAACQKDPEIAPEISIKEIKTLSDQAEVTVLFPELQPGTQVFLDFFIDDQSVDPNVMDSPDLNYEYPEIGGKDCIVGNDHTCQQTIFYLKGNNPYYLRPKARLANGQEITTDIWHYFKTK